MKVSVKSFLVRVEEIAAEEPGYQLGHSGSDHLCDCIGLIIGAILRAGGQWRGLHGSNYAARSEMKFLKKLAGTGELKPGMVVYKAREPGDARYDLPEKYRKGGPDYTGDVRDYYHVGVVVSVYPLRIRHMTTPHPKMDTSIGKWAWYGELRKIRESEEAQIVGKVIIAGGDVSSPIRMRDAPTTAAEILKRIPQGTEVDLIEEQGTWVKVSYEDTIGYVMATFVHKKDDGDMITIPKQVLKDIYDTMGKAYDNLGDVLGLRG